MKSYIHILEHSRLCLKYCRLKKGVSLCVLFFCYALYLQYVTGLFTVCYWFVACDPTIPSQEAQKESVLAEPKTSADASFSEPGKEQQNQDSRIQDVIPDSLALDTFESVTTDKVAEVRTEPIFETKPEPALEEKPDQPRPSSVPTQGVALFNWLKARRYKTYPAESKVHPAIAIHAAQARVFINPLLEQSLKAGKKIHPQGAALIKELYNADGKTLKGWAVMVKTDVDSQGGKGWYWYEVLSTTDSSRPVADGKGVTLCSGCHSQAAAVDFVLTPYPLQ